MNYKTNIIIEKDDYGFYAYCPGLPGCQSQGDTLDELMANIKEAIELYLETLDGEERTAYLSKEILTTSLEVAVA
ncbi:MAG: type II toxin-antitoxin system HicB family antitoxin [Bacteroidetes bacterium]|nr:MAG: type II toxin-antitoxin system HicB family antitoxin [Bacteroidota bacterium]